jgi:uncharacterized protein with ParB-like and HNH nuclease domain
MEANPALIINYFNGFKQSVIPLFQRQYTWGEREWRTLWEDILGYYDRSGEDAKSTHFMGAIVTMPARSVPVGVSKFLIIDGQQRLTTIAVLLCAIRDHLTVADQVQRRRIQKFYLTNDEFEGWDFFKLLPTQGDRPAFSPLIEHPGELLPNSQFKKSYDFYLRRLRDSDDDGNPLDAKRVLEIIESRLMVVSINLSDNDDPYLIFESLNFKGAPLEQADLVRNYFLMRIPVTEQQNVYDNLWVPMQERLGASLTEFMRHFLGSRGEEIRKGDVYAAIKRLVGDSDPLALQTLMNRMEQLSAFYSRIAAIEPEPNQELCRYFGRFSRLDFGTAYPLLLSLYDDYANGVFAVQEFIKVVAILESYIVRRMVVGVPSNSLAGVFITLCKIKPTSDSPSLWLSAALDGETKNRRWPTESEFFERWLRAPIYGSRVCQVLFERIEEHSGHREPAEYTNVSVEHVMPQTLSHEWEQVLGADARGIHSEWLHTVGNLTLTGYNSALSNATFSEKKRVFADSHFELNKYFACCDVWDEPEIRHRAEALFETAKELWPRPSTITAQESATQRTERASFHAACVTAVQGRLKLVFSYLSDTLYEATDSGTRIVCVVSAENTKGRSIPYFWFGLDREKLEFLKGAASAWFCFGCGTPAGTLLVPLSVIEPLLGQMSESNDRDRWHVVIQKRNGRFILRLLDSIDGPDLTGFLVLPAEAASTK